MIIGILNQKGGAGKTTIAINIAATLAARGRRILLVDADPQASAMAWSNARERPPIFPVVWMANRRIHQNLPRIARGFDTVLIDGPPRADEIIRSALLACDIVLVPVQPSPLDVWASAQTVRLIREVQQFKPELVAAFVINRKIVNSAIGRDVDQVLAELDLPILGAQLCQRVVYAESAGQGLSIAEMAPRSEAAREVAALVLALPRVEGTRRAA